MLGVKIVCVGKLKERFYAEAVAEYIKRLTPYCKIDIDELSEAQRPQNPSKAETEAALLKEALFIKARIPASATVIALCIEGRQLDSAGLAELFEVYSSSGVSKLCFIIGGSDGLHDSIKNTADIRLSMSIMTFPHHLARVMLLEQIYRCFKIIEGSKYHK